MNKKPTTVILIGPSISTQPITNSEYPKFILPIINKPLLFHNIRWILPYTEKIVIATLLSYFKAIKSISADLEKDIEIEMFDIKEYRGTYETLMSMKSLIDTEDVIVFKGDLCTDFDMNNMIKFYYENNRKFTALFSKTADRNNVIVYKGNNLLYCTDKISTTNIFKASIAWQNVEINVNSKYECSQLYIFKSEMLNYKISGSSFKSEILSDLVYIFRNKEPIKIFFADSEMFYKIKSYTDLLDVNNYLRMNLSFPKWTPDTQEETCDFTPPTRKRVSFEGEIDEKKSIVGKNLIFEGDIFVHCSVIGTNCEIGTDSKIKHSFVMDNVKIGRNCIIDKCVVGSNAVIPDDTEIKNCRVECGYVFNEKLKAEDKNFVKINF